MAAPHHDAAGGLKARRRECRTWAKDQLVRTPCCGKVSDELALIKRLVLEGVVMVADHEAVGADILGHRYGAPHALVQTRGDRGALAAGILDKCVQQRHQPITGQETL